MAHHFVIQRSNGQTVLPSLAVGESIGCRRNIDAGDSAAFYAVTAGDTFLTNLRANANNIEVPAGLGVDQLWGAGWEVVNVTTEAELRSALAGSTPRVVRGPTNAYIDVESRLNVGPYKYGKDLSLRPSASASNGQVLFFASNYQAHDIFLTNIRVRGRTGKDGQLISFANSQVVPGDVYNIIVDHASVSWAAGDYNLLGLDNNGGGKMYGITVTHSLLSGTLDAHPTASNWTCTAGTLYYLDTYDVMYCDNAHIHCHHRNGLFTTGGAVMLNNYIYNFGAAGGAPLAGVTRGGILDVIGNYSKPGPMSGDNRFQQRYFPGEADDASLYIDDNVDSDLGLMGWEAWVRVNVDTLEEEAIRDANKRSTPLALPLYAPQALSAVDVPAAILADVGCQPLDSYDQQCIYDAQNGTGPSSPYLSVEDAGGYPDLSGL